MNSSLRYVVSVRHKQTQTLKNFMTNQFTCYIPPCNLDHRWFGTWVCSSLYRDISSHRYEGAMSFRHLNVSRHVIALRPDSNQSTTTTMTSWTSVESWRCALWKSTLSTWSWRNLNADLSLISSACKSPARKNILRNWHSSIYKVLISSRNVREDLFSVDFWVG